MRNWQDIRDEVTQHVADLRRDALRRGCSPEEADRLVRAELARFDAIAGRVQSRRWWTGAGLDLGHAWRLLIRQRAASVLVVATLAVAIGACTTVYSLFNRLVFQPLPFPDAERLVLLWETDADDSTRTFIVAAPNYADWVAATTSFESLGIWSEMTFNLAAGENPEQIGGLRASASLFSVLGVPPQLGRVFTSTEETPGHAVAVIADDVWRRHFARRSDVLGQRIRLNGETHEVIGVMPPGFAFPYHGAGVWIPLGLTRQDAERGSHSFWVAGRLREGVTFERARDEVERIGAELRARHRENAGEGATVTRMSDYGLRYAHQMLNALAGAVALVLVIACVNVASLQLAQGIARRTEFALRLSLGATYGRLCRQVAVEGLVIALTAAAAGVALALLSTRLVELLLPPGLLSLVFRGDVTVALDVSAVAFALALAMLSSFFFAFAPLLGLRKPSLHGTLRDGGRTATRFAVRTRGALVAAEIALAVIVLIGAGLMAKSVRTLLNVDPGIDSTNVLTLRVALPQHNTYGRPDRIGFCADLAREASAISGVARISAVSHLPLSGANANRAVTIEGHPEPPPNAGASASYRLICPGYFATLGIALAAGRDFTHADVAGGEDAVIVNRAFVDRYWPEGGALGRRIKIGDIRSTNPWMTIVGISDNVRHFALDAEPVREIYRPYAQAAWPVMTVVAKTASDPFAWERPLRASLTRVEPDLPAATARTMDHVLRRSIGWREAPMRLLAAFAAVGLLLAAVGVYGVLAYYVSQRTREFGVRSALGASRVRLVLLVLRQSALPLTMGVLVGVLGSLAAARLLTGLLFDVQPGDPAVLAAVVGVLVTVALASSWWPARRAAAVDPMVALRDE
jgi:putative ABC transport system permease protein